jgi:hypothetical protein
LEDPVFDFSLMMIAALFLSSGAALRQFEDSRPGIMAAMCPVQPSALQEIPAAVAY